MKQSRTGCSEQRKYYQDLRQGTGRPQNYLALMLVLAYHLDLCQTEAPEYRVNWHKNSLKCRVSSVLTR